MESSGHLTLVLILVSVLGDSNTFDSDTVYSSKVYAEDNSNSGLPLPKPKSWQSSDTVFAVRDDGFQFNATGYTCDDLTSAFDRYYAVIFDVPRNIKRVPKLTRPKAYYGKDMVSVVTGLNVYVKQPCSDGKPKPALGMSEHYKLQVVAGQAILGAETLWGALRGLETFSQLVYQAPYDSHGLWFVNQTLIDDEPRFQHRGFLIDTARHFLDKNVILQFISALAMAKYNVLHWHIVDKQSFPYRSRVFPNLSRKGAYDPYTHVYDQEDIAEVIEFARQRGIRIVAEFDTPGHTTSWGPGQPGLLTPCYGGGGKPDGIFGPIDPSKNSTYEFLEKLFTEVHQVFPDQYVHLGGDEVSFDCWKRNPNINAFMEKIGINKGNYSALESYYISRLTEMVKKIGSDYIVWQDPFDNGVKLDPAAVVHVWRGKRNFNRTGAQELELVTRAGHKAIMSSDWYLNLITYGVDWHQYYQSDPQNFNGTAAQKDLVIGGEGCMWGEFVDGTNLMTRAWPRAAVIAERLWSPANATNLVSMALRLDVHRCRMIRRGLDADPLQPSFCRYEKHPEPPKY